jgi:signal transduction histidine kinase/ActR/RegA family two-component response regulator
MMFSAEGGSDASLQVTVARALQEIINGGMLITDRELTITGWNHWLEINTRQPADSVLGRNLLEVFPDLVARRLDQSFQRALSGQVVVLSQRLHKFVLPMPTTVSRAGLAQMQQSARIAPLIADGRILGTLTLIEDVTERAVYDAELTARANQQAGIAELGRRALSGDDLNALAAKALETVNQTVPLAACAVFEWDAEQKSMALTAGVNWQPDIVGGFTFDPSSADLPDFGAVVSKPIVVSNVAAWPPSRLQAMLLEHGIAAAVNVPVVANNVQLGILGLFSSTMCEPVAEDTHVIEAAANIIGSAIEGRRLEQALRSRVGQLALADERKDEFLAMLAHELRNPLAPILSAMDFLKLNESATDDMQLACEIIDRQIGQMKHLIDDLLDVARITQGKIGLQNEVFDAAVVAVRAVETSRPLIDARRHSLTVSLPSEPQWMMGDPTRIAQVLANLLNNAAKYTDPGGQLSLSVERRGDRLLLKVRDSGVGIAPAMLAHVFDLFTQIDRSLDRAQGGLGIGLTLVRRIVELHGGSVRAFSDGAGAGSEFVVELPALTDSDDAIARLQHRAPRTINARTFDMLVLDDNADAAQLLALLLRALGHSVRTASSGSAAIEAVHRKKPDIMFLDIGLPGMDGYEVARQLRVDFDPQSLLLVALTGYGRPEDRERAREAGFSYHLTKPVDRKTLVDLLDQVSVKAAV